MNRRKEMTLIAAGMLTGAPTAHAAVRQLTATPSAQKVYVDGAVVQMDAYNIGGSNYVKLRDVGEAVGFNVYWDGKSIQIDSDAPYTGTGPKMQTIGQTADERGLTYNADGPVGPLPTPTCDWSAFPEVEVPRAEVRHFAHDDGDSMFIRNIYETRRMQYTIYNAIGVSPFLSFGCQRLPSPFGNHSRLSG